MGFNDSAHTIQTILSFVKKKKKKKKKKKMSVTDWGAKVFLVPPPDPHDCSLQLIKRDYGGMVYRNVLSFGNRCRRIEFTKYANVSV